MLNYRQGDVALEKITSLPKEAKKLSLKDNNPIPNIIYSGNFDPASKEVILAWGEVTGHKHAINMDFATMYEWNGDRILEIKPGAKLRHQEHDPITLDPGIYKIVHQQEYTPKEVVRVRD
jgi:hypothetical protein